MFGIGAQELVVIAVIALIVFGPERLPEMAARLAKALRDVRRLSDELTGEFQRSLTGNAPAAADHESATGAAAAPAVPDAIGSALARSLRVETVPDAPSPPSGAAQGTTDAVATPTRHRPRDDATLGGTPTTKATEAGPLSSSEVGPTPALGVDARPGGLATAPATTGQAGAVAHRAPEEAMPPRAGSADRPPAHGSGDPHAAFRERRRRATYRRPRR